MHEITVLNTHLAKLKIQIETIEQTIGEKPNEFSIHSFKETAFTIPTACDFCNQNIWGLMKAGSVCKGIFMEND